MSRSQARRRGADDRGASLLELAMLLPVLALFAFGTAELSMAWVANTRVEDAAGAAARVGAASGARVEADRDILVALQAALPSGELSRVDRVVVYRPGDAIGTVPTGCIKAMNDPSEVGTPACNTYSGATLRTVSMSSMTGFGGGVTAKDRYWAPSVRHDSLLDPPDYIGVWVRTTHESLTGFAFKHMVVAESTVVRIQPDLAG